MTNIEFSEIMIAIEKLSAKIDNFEAQLKLKGVINYTDEDWENLNHFVNRLTSNTMDKTDKGEGLTRFEDSKSLFEHLHIGIKDTCN
jgi:hypothetical protein